MTVMVVSTRMRRTLSVGAVSLLATGALVVPTTAAVARPEPAPGSAASQQGALANPDEVLGGDWQESSDALVTGLGDVKGFHLYVAREKEAFRWSTLATLNAGITDSGAWTGKVCVTGSGRYAAVVYAPAITANKPALITAGAFAAVVDIRTGEARQVASAVQLAYFNPGCGPTEDVLLTRSIGVDQQQTDLIKVDARGLRENTTRRIKAQLTNPVAGPDGDYGIARGTLVRIGAKGELNQIATPGGQPFAVRATANGAIDLLTVQAIDGHLEAAKPGSDRQERAVAYRYINGKQIRLGDGPRTRLELFGLAGGRNLLVGEIEGIETAGIPDLVAMKADRKVRAVSRQGHLLALELLSQPSGAEPTAHGGSHNPLVGGKVRVTVLATRTGLVRTGDVVTERKAAADSREAQREKAERAGVTAAEPIAGSPGEPACAVPRNDVRRQAYQPSANQVEWAVNLAVQGRLTNQRPQNYLKAGQPAYTPQGMFPLPAGPRVPAQVMLAILAQETNMYQASWHGVPGDAGNPLVSDYYGIRPDVEGKLGYINYTHSDCGYGISQVTDGMQASSNKWTPAQRSAISSDYAANIAAGLQILVQKWNEVRATNSGVNNDDPKHIENWFLAIWGYNSGVYQNTGSGAYGVGYLNNPANPSYPANREPFLRTTLEDASHPSDWPYPEKIMGWAETPQWQWIEPYVKYLQPNFGWDTPDQLTLPSRYQFCGTVNNCTPGATDPCPAWNSSCWWHGTTSWFESDTAREFATEQLRFAVGDPEPETVRVYPRNCSPLGVSGNSRVVDDLADSSNNLLGCAGQPWGGKFTLRPGHPPGTNNALYGHMDLHQLGAGYLGHSWFTHIYHGQEEFLRFGTDRNLRQVIGTWSPDLKVAGRYRIIAHLPSHGALGTGTYVIKSNLESSSLHTCRVDQDVTNWTDKWVDVGTYELGIGARVQLSNIIPRSDQAPEDQLEPNGTVNIAWDAMAFIFQGGNGQCGSVYTP